MKSFQDFILNENLAQAKSILQKKGLTVDDETYKKIIQKTNRDGYTGLITKLILVDGEDMQEVFDLYNDLKKHSYDLAKISKLPYDEIIDYVYQEVDSEIRKSDVKKLFSKDGYTYFLINYEGGLELGSPAWCLKTKSDWVNEVDNGNYIQWVVIRNDKIKGNKLYLSVPNTYTSKVSYTSAENSIRYGVTVTQNGEIVKIHDDNNDNKMKSTGDKIVSTISKNIRSVYKEDIAERIRKIFEPYSDIQTLESGFFVDIQHIIDEYENYPNEKYIVGKKISGYVSKHITIGKTGENKWLFGIIDADGTVIIPIKYEELVHFYNIDSDIIGENLMAKLDDKFGIVNRKGEQVIPFIYDYMRNDSIIKDDSVEGECFSVRLGNKWGGIDENGKVIVPIKYRDQLQWEYWKKYQTDIIKSLPKVTKDIKDIIYDKNLLSYFGSNKLVDKYLELHGLEVTQEQFDNLSAKSKNKFKLISLVDKWKEIKDNNKYEKLIKSLIGQNIVFLCERAYDSTKGGGNHTCYYNQQPPSKLGVGKLMRSKHKGIIEDIHIRFFKTKNQPRILVKMPFSIRFHRLDNIFEFITDLPKDFKVSESKILSSEKDIINFLKYTKDSQVETFYGGKWHLSWTDDVGYIDSFDGSRDYLVDLTISHDDLEPSDDTNNFIKFSSEDSQKSILKDYEIKKLRPFSERK
jgi:hypothetical protein